MDKKMLDALAAKAKSSQPQSSNWKDQIQRQETCLYEQHHQSQQKLPPHMRSKTVMFDCHCSKCKRFTLKV